ncbi:hypothetical protein HYH02_001678 [Chlamydomonas schloesseri]|uniref:Uncharacterized protein n=1 Tax=Chlamydomonas schloesseri TaxID=2026947 RepID=A0A836BBC5_9CHLO|nr:hypothetical protein HYH02_001678 [Chlamydomonas schloesseri]|eukprot:KAG2453457.1 hypothetical protein HYH02_001678 [Chlamydomonas schloesseri]
MENSSRSLAPASRPTDAVLKDMMNSERLVKSLPHPSPAVVGSVTAPVPSAAKAPAMCCVAADVLEQLSHLQLTPQPAATPPQQSGMPLTGFSFHTPASVASNFTGFLTHPQRTPEERVLRLFADEDDGVDTAGGWAATSSNFRTRMEQALSPCSAHACQGDGSAAASPGARTPAGPALRAPACKAYQEDDSSDDEIDLEELVRLGVSPISISSCCRTPVTPAEVLAVISPGEAVGTDLGVSPIIIKH